MHWCHSGLRLARPYQDLSLFVDGDVPQREFFPHVVQQGAVNAEDECERAVRHPSIALEKPHHP